MSSATHLLSRSNSSSSLSHAFSTGTPSSGKIPKVKTGAMSDRDVDLLVKEEAKKPEGATGRSWVGGLLESIKRNPRAVALCTVAGAVGSVVTGGVIAACLTAHIWAPHVAAFFAMAWHPVGWAVLGGIGAVGLAVGCMYLYKRYNDKKTAAANAAKTADMQQQIDELSEKAASATSESPTKKGEAAAPVRSPFEAAADAPFGADSDSDEGRSDVAPSEVESSVMGTLNAETMAQLKRMNPDLQGPRV